MTVPAGWYDDGSGRQRWWDGAQWTEHFAPVEPTAAAPAAAAPIDAAPIDAAETDAAPETSEEFDLDATARREDIPRASTASEAPAYEAPAAPSYDPPVAPVYEAPTAPAYAPPVSPAAPAYAAPTAGNPAYMASAYAAPAYAAAAPQAPKSVSVLGFVGLGLAVLGTVLCCIPTLYTVIPGLVVLFAALVISIIALFRKGTQKWPGITGAALSVVGGIIGGIVLVVVLLISAANAMVQELPSSLPTPMSTDTFESMGRPAPEMIAAGYTLIALSQDGVEQYTEPDVAACIGEHLYDSDLSDEALWDVAIGRSVDDADVQQAITAAEDACLTQ